jgi:hypothetical protein
MNMSSISIRESLQAINQKNVRPNNFCFNTSLTLTLTLLRLFYRVYLVAVAMSPLQGMLLLPLLTTCPPILCPPLSGQ